MLPRKRPPPWNKLPRKLRNEILRAALIEGKSYAEIGRQYGKCRERIRQIVLSVLPGLKRNKSKKSQIPPVLP